MTGYKESYSWVYIGLAILIGGAILYFLFLSSNSDYVKIKYRDSKVNISTSNFESLGKSDSTVKDAWYDSSNKYMVIKLDVTYYQYCGMSNSEWGGLKNASSLYEFYQDNIKGNFDCRFNYVPQYK